MDSMVALYVDISLEDSAVSMEAQLLIKPVPVALGPGSTLTRLVIKWMSRPL